MSKQKMIDAILDYYNKTTKEETAKFQKKVRALLHHEMTCGDLSHGHGAIKIEWEATESDKDTKRRANHRAKSELARGEGSNK